MSDELTREQILDHLRVISESPKAEIYFAYRDAVLAYIDGLRDRLDEQTARAEWQIEYNAELIASIAALMRREEARRRNNDSASDGNGRAMEMQELRCTAGTG